MDEVEKKREVSRILRSNHKAKTQTGSRRMFDDSEYRDILTLGKQTIAIIEGKLGPNKRSCYVNLIFKDDKHKTLDNVRTLLDRMYNSLSGVRAYFISVHIQDEILQGFCSDLDYIKIVKRDLLLRYKLPHDGMHVSFIKG